MIFHSWHVQEQPGIRQCADIGFSIALQIDPAAIRRHQAGGPPDVTTVVEPEVRRHAGQYDDIGFLERVAPLVPAMQRVRGSEEAARHAREIDGNPEGIDGPGNGIGLPRIDKCLATDHEQRPLGIRNLAGSLLNYALRRCLRCDNRNYRRHRDRQTVAGRDVPGTCA